MEKFTSSLRAWLEYSLDQMSDVSFWWGVGTAQLGWSGLAALPALRGAIAPLTSGASRIFTGYFYYRKRSYPDIVSATQHILLHHPDGRLEFCLDTIFGERALATIMWNPYRAWMMRQTATWACDADPLVRLNPYGPKPKRWFRRRLTAARIGELRKQIRRRYKLLYAPLVGAIAEHYTNPGAVRASRGERMAPMRIIIAKTYTGDQKHHRVHGIHEWMFLHWPEECPQIARAEYRARFELTTKLLAIYRRAPWRFDFVDEFVPVDQVPEGYVEWLYRRRERG